MAKTHRDLVGTQVPYDVMSANWKIGHHVLCERIVPLENSPDYLVNGRLILPVQIANECLSMLEQGMGEKAGQGRPASTSWIAVKSRWHTRAWRKFLRRFERKELPSA